MLAELYDTSDCPTDKCTGTLDGGTVMVQNPADVARLWRLGFYGKGVFSRSTPSHVLRAYGRETASSVAGTAGGGWDPERKRTRRAAHATEEGGAAALERRLCLHAQWKEERERLSRSVEELKSGGGEAVCSCEGERSVGGTSTPTILTPLPTADPPSVSASSLDVNSDPYPVVEPLALIPEEALYLVAEVGRLCLFSPDLRDCYTVGKLWELFCVQHRLFPYTYAAYRHYRRKGWVPKSGLKFGIHFLLYKEGPEFFHSSYAVLVKEGVRAAVNKIAQEEERESGLQGREGEMEGVLQGVEGEVRGGLQGGEGEMEGVLQGVEGEVRGGLQAVECEMEGVLQSVEGKTEGALQGVAGEIEVELQELKWRDVAAHCRVCESAAKELVICHVSRPHGMALGEGEVPPLHRVGEMEIFEVAVSRWIPKKER